MFHILGCSYKGYLMWVQLSSKSCGNAKSFVLWNVHLPRNGGEWTWNLSFSSSISPSGVPQPWCPCSSYLFSRYCASRLCSLDLPQIRAIRPQQAHPTACEPLLFSYLSLRHHLIPCNLQSGTISWTVLWLLCPAGSCGSATHRHFIFSATCCLSLLPQFLPSFSVIYFLFLYVC